jgi:NADH-quinone oxidoreductase subunit J
MAVAAAAALALLGSFLYALRGTHWATNESAAYPVTTLKGLGDLLLGKYLMPFEVVSILLLAVLVGSLVIARRSVQ